MWAEAKHLIAGLLQGTFPLAMLLLLAFTVPRLGSRLFHRLERAGSKLARHRVASIILVGVTAFVMSASYSSLVRMPVPVINDEFSYLLGADTFLHGRLANPPHPLWLFFDTFMVLQHPTYATTYPPGQSLFLAVGSLVGGHPIVGAWFSGACAAAALCWALMAWIRPRWALLGGLLAAIHPLLFSWTQSYWGGSVATLGGALLIGALRRITAEPKTGDSLALGFGLALLANSRPFEGLVLTVVSAPVFGMWIFGSKHPPFTVVLRKVILPVGIVLLCVGSWMAYYNYRVTDHPFLAPKMVGTSQKAVAPPLV